MVYASDMDTEPPEECLQESSRRHYRMGMVMGLIAGILFGLAIGGLIGYHLGSDNIFVISLDRDSKTSVELSLGNTPYW